MNRQRFFLVMSLALLGLLTVFALSMSDAVTVAFGSAPDAPLRLAPPLPTPTAAPGVEGRSVSTEGGPQGQADLPDLVVESIEVAPSQPFIFNEAQIRVTVRNQGTKGVDDDNNFLTDLYIGAPTVPTKGTRGLTCLFGTAPGTTGECNFPDAGFRILVDGDATKLPWGVQGFWLGGIGSTYELTATVVFSQPGSYYIFAQADTPQTDYPNGNVIESNENNNIYPTGPSVYVDAVAPRRFTENTFVDFYDNYASSLEIVPVTATLTDITGIQILSDAKMTLGRYEEPPVDWGTANPTIPPDYTSPDYNVISPDTQISSDAYWEQIHPVVATDGISFSHRLVVVWEDYRNGMTSPDIYLRWSDGETSPVPGEFRQDWGTPGTNELKVSDKPSGAAAKYPSAAVAPNGDIVVVWQDNRDYYTTNPDDFDMYFQKYHFGGGGIVPDGPNYHLLINGCPGKAETKPDIAVGTDNTFYVVWQSQCATFQSTIWAISGLGHPSTWPPPSIVPDPSAQECRDPKVDIAATKVITNVRIDYSDPENPVALYDLTDKNIVVVTWHDTRGFEPGGCSGTDDDIWVAYSDDNMASFSRDRRVNDDCATDSFRYVQDQPAATVTQDKIDWTIFTPGGVPVELENIPVPALHVAWRDFRNSTGTDPTDPTLPGNDPDVYYSYCPFKPDVNPPYLVALTIGENKKLNNGDVQPWQSSPPKQSDPAIAGRSYLDVDNTERKVPYDVYVVWSDSRNYNSQGPDQRNYDLYMWLYGNELPEGLTLVNTNLNDEVKVHGYQPDHFYASYGPDRPPWARQVQPSIAATLEHDGNLIKGGYVYLAWADDRLATDNSGVHDVFFTRSNLTYFTNYDLHNYGPFCPGAWGKGAGAFISKAFDACPGVPEGDPDCDAQWFKLDYGGSTPSGTWIGVQTRTADYLTGTNGLLNAEWWPDTLIQSGGCEVPLWGYAGRGADIVGPSGKWPKAKYAQYRVNFWTKDSAASPEVLYVSLFYGSVSQQGRYGSVFLPILLKDVNP